MNAFQYGACLALSLALSGCMGDDNDNDIDGPVWTVNGAVKDAEGKPVADAEVSVTLDRAYIGKTNSNGEYSFDLPKNYSFPEHFSGLVNKAGYLPKPLLFGYANQQLSHQKLIETRPLTGADLLFPASLEVIHLGDSYYGGAVNSQFQFPNASGKYWLDSAVLSAEQKAAYRQLCISLHAKGIDERTTDNNVLSLSKNGAVGSYMLQDMAATDQAGAYTEQQYCFNLDRFAANDRIQVQLNSSPKNGDYDDFEFIAVTGLLKP